MQRKEQAPISVFISYAHEDEALRKQLDIHLSLLRRQRLVASWNDRLIAPGSRWDEEIDDHLAAAQIILLLISPDFLASDYCYGIEMQRALEKHKAGEAHVIPILLRPVDWESSPFASLQCLPPDALPITQWENRDQAWVTVVKGIRALIDPVVDPSQLPLRLTQSMPLETAIACLSACG